MSDESINYEFLQKNPTPEATEILNKINTSLSVTLAVKFYLEASAANKRVDPDESLVNYDMQSKAFLKEMVYQRFGV